MGWVGVAHIVYNGDVSMTYLKFRPVVAGYSSDNFSLFSGPIINTYTVRIEVCE